MFGYFVAIVAGIRKEDKTAFECLDIFPCNCYLQTIQRLINHRQGTDLRAVCTIFINISDRLLDFSNFKISQAPVSVFPGKPYFGMMHLNGQHEFSKSGPIRTIQPAS